MKLLVSYSAYWPSEEVTRKKFWLYLASCKQHGIEPQAYGQFTDAYLGNAAMRIYGLLDFLKTIDPARYTHILFTHAWDVLFTAPLSDITPKYRQFGSPPMLMGAVKADMSDLRNTVDGGRFRAMFDQTQPYWYPAWCMFIAEIPYLVDRFSRIEKGHYNEAVPWTNALESKLIEPVYDTRCSIFQTIVADMPEAEVVDGRMHNSLTGTDPAVVHFLVGDADQETGRDEWVLPWAIKLGVLTCS